MSLRGYWICISLFLLLYFYRGFFVYSPSPVHVYIQAFGPEMNISDIHNNMNWGAEVRIQAISELGGGGEDSGGRGGGKI
jgi:hypothetical protein